ncbi:Uncharacterised protein [Leclercia adecarboxylata]|uniref:Uncharacterized protein n=1 Tax=Leclercia adecarboxylata TaxID=83655 RepID=A0A4U9IF14_9ENTR|nr:Uncharacterised protein [Leclercia adecarboxylata]
MTTKSVDQLQTGLDLYLLNGYVESNSFNDPNDDTLEYLGYAAHGRSTRGAKILSEIFAAVPGQ